MMFRRKHTQSVSCTASGVIIVFESAVNKRIPSCSGRTTGITQHIQGRLHKDLTPSRLIIINKVFVTGREVGIDDGKGDGGNKGRENNRCKDTDDNNKEDTNEQER